MKRLLLSLVLVVASLATMAQEHGTWNRQDEMVRKGYNLYFVQGSDKVLVSDGELSQILDEDTFGTYCSQRRKYKLGNALRIGGWAGLGGGLAIGIPGFYLLREHVYDSWGGLGCIMFMAGAGLVLEGIALIPTGYIMRGSSAKKINRIADEYNQNIAVSYRLSPSIMPVNVPQSQGNVAYGMTFSINF
jgi:hypothetical protein